MIMRKILLGAIALLAMSGPVLAEQSLGHTLRELSDCETYVMIHSYMTTGQSACGLGAYSAEWTDGARECAADLSRANIDDLKIRGVLKYKREEKGMGGVSAMCQWMRKEYVWAMKGQKP